ncbi:Serine protease family s10, partial [Globisporangium splendens]
MRASESIPLTTRDGSYAVPDVSTRFTTGLKTYAKYGLVAALVFAAGNVMFASDSSSPIQTLPVLPDTVNAAKKLEFPGAADEIKDLFGKPDEYTSRLYSGYLPLRNGGEAFYFFAESQSEEPAQDPVLLWLNGGPGASSLAGCFSENGPLLVSADGKSLIANEYGWNKNANLICIESPIGVGFSYNASGVYVSDDLSQAADLHEGLQQFFVKFPHLRANDFIISGESYGGIYVPTTARQIVEGNLKGEPKINLKKFVVGNGVNEFSGLSQYLFAYYHGILSTEEYQNIRTSCPDLQEFKSTLMKNSTLYLNSACGQAALVATTKMMSEQINMYNVAGNCAGTQEETIRELAKRLLEKPTGFPHPLGMPPVACVSFASVETYFNIPKVRDAMHTKDDIDRWNSVALSSQVLALLEVIPGLQDVTIDKSRLFDYTTTLNWEVTPIWKDLLAHNISGVIYHGDADMVCDFIGGLWAVESLKLQRLVKRKPWSVELEGTQQTGGFVEEFEGLTYLTVKGAGHLVPMWKPVEAKRMLDLFVLEREG